MQNFQTLYLNWNPEFYPIKIVQKCEYHVHNPKKKFFDEEFCIETNPQFLIELPPHENDLELRILVDRHVSDLLGEG